MIAFVGWLSLILVLGSIGNLTWILVRLIGRVERLEAPIEEGKNRHEP